MPQIWVKVDTDTKREAETILKSMGLTTSSAVRMFLLRVIADKAIPFPVTGGERDA